MGESIGQVLSFAVGVAASPLAITAVILMLATPHGRNNGLAFVGGWVAGLTVLGAVVLFAASGGNASESGAPADWVSVVKLVLGVVLLLVAVRQWRGRPHGEVEPELPSWMHTVDRFTPGRSAGVAVALAAVNPKNLVLTLGAAAAIAQVGGSTGDQAVALAVFVVVASVGVIAPVAIYLFMGDRAAKILDGLRERMSRDNATVMAVICLIIAWKLIGDGISGLST
jgi:threonine/homoserine/homoserine lactone efflux protein